MTANETLALAAFVEDGGDPAEIAEIEEWFGVEALNGSGA